MATKKTGKKAAKSATKKAGGQKRSSGAGAMVRQSGTLRHSFTAFPTNRTTFDGAGQTGTLATIYRPLDTNNPIKPGDPARAMQVSLAEGTVAGKKVLTVTLVET